MKKYLLSFAVMAQPSSQAVWEMIQITTRLLRSL